MRPLRTFPLGVAVLVAGAGLAQAQQTAGMDFIELFGKLDANNDEVIEREEVPESGQAAFDRLLKLADTNKNAQLDRDEYRNLLQSLRDQARELAQNAPKRLQAMDKDGDGKVSRDEFTGPAPLFNRLDADKDGFVTKVEASQFRGPGLGGPAGAGPGAPGKAALRP